MPKIRQGRTLVIKSFKDAIPGFCAHGAEWAREQPNLITAWRRCENGRWMAWWLFKYCGVDHHELDVIADSILGTMAPTFDDSLHDVPPERLLAYAKRLRTLYHPSGTKRQQALAKREAA